MKPLDKLAKKMLEFNEVLESCKQESDRGAAIIAASHLDDFMGECLKSFFVDDRYVEEHLFEVDRPLSTFSSRIHMAFALGFINRETRNNLNHIRKIRNHFAHSALEASFNTSRVKDLCNNFSVSVLVDTRGVIENHAKNYDDPRERFLFVVGMTGLVLQSAMSLQARRVVPEIEAK